MWVHLHALATTHNLLTLVWRLAAIPLTGVPHSTPRGFAAPARPIPQGCPPFSHLTITGGSIGCGPPMALGAALARPGSRVINFQADGSAMYTLQVGACRREGWPRNNPVWLGGTVQGSRDGWYASRVQPYHRPLPTPCLQALWSQARERARVLTVICANSSYAILKVRGHPHPAVGPGGKLLCRRQASY